VQLPVAPSQLSVVQGLLSSQDLALPAWQAPYKQTSPVVQALPSSQLALLLVLVQLPVVVSQPSVVQGLLSLQTLALPGWQLPPKQLSLVVQALPSLQLTALLVVRQLPVAWSQLSVVQRLPSSQVVAGPPLQLPLWQTSPLVHALPSSQVSEFWV
jgi:hypothetical protein